MMSKNTQLENLTYQVELLQKNVALLTEAMSRTDNFNNWTLAQSLASIANALVKRNTLEKRRQNTKEETFM